MLVIQQSCPSLSLFNSLADREWPTTYLADVSCNSVSSLVKHSVRGQRAKVSEGGEQLTGSNHIVSTHAVAGD